MAIEVRTNLEEALLENNRLLQENLVAAKVSNMLSLGRTMNIDSTVPTNRQKLERHMSLIEQNVRSGLDD